MVSLNIYFYQESDHEDTEEDKQTIAQDEAQVKFALLFNLRLLNCQ